MYYISTLERFLSFSTDLFAYLILSIDVKTDSRFSSLGHAKRILAISAIHGELDKLTHLHDTIFPHIQVGDRVIYTGNYMGYGESSVGVIDEMLSFRRAVLAKRGMIPSDLIYLRGGQEEMWQKLLQLQFAPDPTKALVWMLGNGLKNTLYAYGLCPHDGIEACRQGIVGISQWTTKIRTLFKNNSGHEAFTTHLVRAAFMPETSDYPMLFVHAGIDCDKPLTNQGDNFWWGHDKFNHIEKSYDPFQKVVRGYDPTHNGIQYNGVKATIDGGCGFGGTLVCAVFDDQGNVIDNLQC